MLELSAKAAKGCAETGKKNDLSGLPALFALFAEIGRNDQGQPLGHIAAMPMALPCAPPLSSPINGLSSANGAAAGVADPPEVAGLRAV